MSVVSPADERPVRLDPAGEPEACAHGDEGSGWRLRLARLIVAPADHFAVLLDPAGMKKACGDLREGDREGHCQRRDDLRLYLHIRSDREDLGVRRHLRLAKLIAAPADDRPA